MSAKHFKLSFLKGHYALIPLYGAVGFGIGLSAVYTLRLAMQNPDVSWRRKSNPEPWQHRVDDEGKTVRYKLHQAPEGWKPGRTQYGKEAHTAERPPIEKLWAEYQAENAHASAHH
jgi:NADH dehydrogenase (ubiquinone) 1 alpha subcomplex subunit 4